jgi:hypothetical protein
MVNHVVLVLMFSVTVPLPTVSSDSLLKSGASNAAVTACTVASAKSRSISDKNVKIMFRNAAPFNVDLYWVNFEGQEAQGDELPAGHSTERQTYPGHVFRARQQGSGILLLEQEALDQPKNTVMIKTCTEAANYKPPKGARFQAPDPELIESLVHDQAASCEPAGESSHWSCVRKMLPEDVSTRNGTAYGFQDADQLEKNGECRRARKIGDTTDDGYSNRRHRESVNRHTKGPGYLKMSMDPAIFKVLKEWAGNHSHLWTNSEPSRSRKYDNAESIGGCYANTHQFPFSKLDLDAFQQIRRQIVAHMTAVLEWWTQKPLEHTSTYGMRIYKRNAMLVNHVDRQDTHLASAVIQVHQTTDPDGGWPLEVVGADDIVREVYLQPGEMVLYEGARFLHGRPMRFQGDYFGNIFTHFKPSVYYQGNTEDDL